MQNQKRICGIMGNPLSHSLSPKMHNAAFSHLELDFEYNEYEINEDELGHTLDDLISQNFRGLNVTHPYKIKIMDHLDVLDENAKSIGSVNTIVHKDGKLFGYNTDSAGGILALKEGRSDIENELNHILILGAGGAARAIAYPLVKMGNRVFISNRTRNTTDDLIRSLKKYGDCSSVEITDLPTTLENMDILINATPLGMKGGPLGSLITKEMIRPDMTVFDMVYNPKNTPLVLAAKEIGAHVIYGFQMFVWQGALAFELWTNEKAPVQKMKQTVLENLEPEEGVD
jgi:shikimate dehydrogenase